MYFVATAHYFFPKILASMNIDNGKIAVKSMDEHINEEVMQ